MGKFAKLTIMKNMVLAAMMKAACQQPVIYETAIRCIESQDTENEKNKATLNPVVSIPKTTTAANIDSAGRCLSLDLPRGKVPETGYGKLTSAIDAEKAKRNMSRPTECICDGDSMNEGTVDSSSDDSDFNDGSEFLNGADHQKQVRHLFDSKTLPLVSEFQL